MAYKNNARIVSPNFRNLQQANSDFSGGIEGFEERLLVVPIFYVDLPKLTMTTKAVLRSIKNVTNGYSSAQILVRECTSNDPSSPTVTRMSQVADLTYKNGSFQDIMEIIDKRLNDKGKNWRHVAKALTLLEYLIRYGSDDVVIWAKDNLYIIKTLREFHATDSVGHDQGSIIRVKAKELTSLLQDDERLLQEREAAGLNASRGRRRRKNDSLPRDDDVYDEDLQKALEESRLTAEEEARRRKNQSDESLERAIQLSLEEEEMRKKNQSLLDLDANPPDVYGFYQQQAQTQGQIIGYDMFGNPVYGNQPMATGYLQNAYQDASAQQLLQQQQLEAQQLAAQQYAAQQLEQQQALYLQQQQLYQQQLNAATQAQMQAGSNNPFAQNQELNNNSELLRQQREAEEENRRREEEFKQQQLLLLQQQQQQQSQEQQTPMKAHLTGSQKMNDQYSELNQLLAQGTGIDTFGNTGDARIPAQFTKTGTFINSQGTGYKQVSNSNKNPFLDTQFTGLAKVGAPVAPPSRIIPSETGYGFGNQQRPQQQQQNQSQGNYGSLIDL